VIHHQTVDNGVAQLRVPENGFDRWSFPLTVVVKVDGAEIPPCGVGDAGGEGPKPGVAPTASLGPVGPSLPSHPSARSPR
jgi:hypothetical protein